MVTATPEMLVEELKSAGPNKTRLTAVLWTWLENHLITLGSLREKPPAIQARAEDKPRFTEIEEMTEEMTDWLRQNPLPRAAELLALIDLDLASSPKSVFESTTGFGGEEVVVAYRDPRLASMIDKRGAPPVAVEHPTLTALAPRTRVCPKVVNGIKLEIVTPDEAGWEIAEAQLERGMSEPKPFSLCVHLDTLGEDGLSGWTPQTTPGAGCYLEKTIRTTDEERCVEEARAAVEAACGDSSILLMPELAATPAVLTAIKGELEKRNADGIAPALTVVGLYHDSPGDQAELDRDLVCEGELAERVNEAVVLGPDGEELWRHRKLSCAADEEGALVEDIRLGESLKLLRTPIGIVAVPICLDAFAPHVRERLIASPAEVLLIPSLSPKVLRHRTSLEHLVQVLWGAAFVCNRAPDPSTVGSVWDEEENRSFWAIQRKSVERNPKRGNNRPSFVFRLAEELGRDDGEESE